MYLKKVVKRESLSEYETLIVMGYSSILFSSCFKLQAIGQLKVLNHIQQVYSSSSGYSHFILWFSLCQIQYEFDASSFQEVLFVLVTQFTEIGGLKKEPQNLKLFSEFPFLIFPKEFA